MAKRYMTAFFEVAGDPRAIQFDDQITRRLAEGAELVGGPMVVTVSGVPTWMQAMLMPDDTQPAQPARAEAARSATDDELRQLFADLRADLEYGWRGIALSQQMELAVIRIDEFSARVLAGELVAAKVYADQIAVIVDSHPGRSEVNP